MIGTAEEAIRYIEDKSWNNMRLGLDRIRALLAALGNPQKSLRFVHVAGSNGKGSTSAMLDAVLRAAGYRCGFFSSPYLFAFAESMRVDGMPISEEQLLSVAKRVEAAAEAMEDHPSSFELLTAAALLHFRDCGCEFVVLEVGMGGATDSTNAIDAPEVAVITNITLEHTEYLGHTLAEIAEAKSGILKAGCEVICYDAAQEAVSVVRRRAEEYKACFTLAEAKNCRLLARDLAGQDFLYGGEAYHLALSGAHQLRNAAVVMETVEALRRRGHRIPPEAVRRGLAEVIWPARFELLQKDPPVILDGGHNPQCAAALAEAIRELLPERKVLFLLGVLKDKDYAEMLRILAPLAEEVLCAAPKNERALAADQLAACAEAQGLHASVYEDVASALNAGRVKAGDNVPLVIFGSLYLAGEVKRRYALHDAVAMHGEEKE